MATSNTHIHNFNRVLNVGPPIRNVPDDFFLVVVFVTMAPFLNVYKLNFTS